MYELVDESPSLPLSVKLLPTPAPLGVEVLVPLQQKKKKRSIKSATCTYHSKENCIHILCWTMSSKI